MDFLSEKLPLRPYWALREHFTIDEGLVLYGCRLLIPSAMHRQVLQTLHSSHQGIERTKRRARLAVYWPGMDRDIERTVRGCRECVQDLLSQAKEPMESHNEPTRVFEHMAADIFPTVVLTSSLSQISNQDCRRPSIWAGDWMQGQ